MTAEPTYHPDRERLSDFVLGKLELSECNDVESHLAVCESCCRTLKQIEEDTFVGLVRKSGRRGPATPETVDAVPASPQNTPPNPAEAETLPPQSADACDVLDLPSELAKHARYRVVEIIGAGGMGSVYKAEHRLMQRTVALKVIHPRFVQSKQAIERFRREVQAAARLHHPNIVTAYDAEQAGDLHLLVMEFVPGVDLSKVVEKRGPLPIAEACEYVRQAALGLQHAHENGMVHRDIKPQNLVLAASRQMPASGDSALLGGVRPNPTVKILDFGLASLTTEAIAHDETSPTEVQKTGLTEAGSLMGTPDYMAPEQGRDARRADIRSDIYSLGCTLYYLLSGKVPFPGGTAIDKVIAHSERKAPSITEHRKGIPPALVRVLEKMMAKDAGSRYQIPADVVADLSPLSPWTQGIGNEGRRRRRWLAAIAGAAFLAALLPIFLAVLFAMTNPSRLGKRNTGSIASNNATSNPLPNSGSDQREWLALFNGNDLQGWSPVGDPRLWEVRDGVLRAGGGGRGWLSTVDEYHDFQLRLEYRLSARGNTGVFLRAPARGNLSGAEFLEVQLIGEAGFPNLPELHRTGALYDIAPPKVSGVGREAGEWNQIEIRAEGTRVSVILNGKLVQDADIGAASIPFAMKSNATRTGGHIGLQCHDTLAEFRNIRLRRLRAPSPREELVLQGTWQPLLFEQNGQRIPQQLLQELQFPTQFFFRDDEWAAVSADGKWFESTFKIHTDTNPMWIDVVGSIFEGMPNLHGIMKVDGDVATICVAEQSQPRPVAFRTEGKDKQMMIVARRVHPASHRADVAMKALLARAADLQADPVQLAADIRSFRQEFMGMPQAMAAATLLRRLPSPLDELDATMIAPELRNPKVVNLAAAFRAHPGPVTSLAFLPDGTLVSCCGSERILRLWDLSTKSPREVRSLTGHTDTVWGVACSADGRLLASGSEDKTVRVWDLTNPGSAPIVVDGFRFAATGLDFSPDGKMLATGTFDPKLGGIIRLLEVGGGSWKERAAIPGHTALVQGVSFSPDGKTLASGALDGTVRIWELSGSQPRQRAMLRHPDWVYPVRFSAKGTALMTGCKDGRLRIWDMAPTVPDLRAELPGTGGVYSIDGQMLLSSGSGKVIVWDAGLPLFGAFAGVSKGKKLTEWDLPDVGAIAFSPDSRHAALGFSNGVIYIIRLENTVRTKRTSVPTAPHHRVAIDKGLAYLVQSQQADGHWEAAGGQHPVALTALAGMALLMERSTIDQGRYAEPIRRAVDWLLKQSHPNGLIGRPEMPGGDARYMFGHGYAMLFLASVYSHDKDADRRNKMRQILTKAVEFTAAAKTTGGGWGYVAAKDGNDFDEAATTVVQWQALRAARNVGILVPRKIIDADYLRRFTGPNGGIVYSLKNGQSERAALTAAALAAGEFDSDQARKWLTFCRRNIRLGVRERIGHDEFMHYYYAQALYILGDGGFQKLFPESKPEERLTWSMYRTAEFDGIVSRQAADGSWPGAFIGPVYATACYLTVLQLDNAAVPIYQR